MKGEQDLERFYEMKAKNNVLQIHSERLKNQLLELENRFNFWWEFGPLILLRRSSAFLMIPQRHSCIKCTHRTLI